MLRSVGTIARSPGAMVMALALLKSYPAAHSDPREGIVATALNFFTRRGSKEAVEDMFKERVESRKYDAAAVNLEDFRRLPKPKMDKGLMMRNLWQK